MSYCDWNENDRCRRCKRRRPTFIGDPTCPGQPEPRAVPPLDVAALCRVTCTACGAELSCAPTKGRFYLGRTELEAVTWQHAAPFCAKWRGPERAACLPDAFYK